MATRYPHDKTSVDRGNEFQDFVMLALLPYGILVQTFGSKHYQHKHGESPQGIEIKLDMRCTETKRLSIETAEKTNASHVQWSPSGIYRQDNTWLYVQGNYDLLFVFSKNWLQQLHEAGRYEEAEYGGTVRKFYLPLADARKYAVLVIERQRGG